MTLRLGEKGLYYLWEDVIPTSSTTPLRVTRAERISLARIDDRVLGSVIYLYESEEDAKKGSEFGGSGFLLSVQSETHSDYFHVYAVSNSHVVGDPGYHPVVRVTSAARVDRFKGQIPFMAGNREIIPLGWNQWESHPNADVAIASLGYDQILHVIGPTYGRRFSFTIPSFLLLTHEVIDAFDICPGDDVYMCGRFTHHAGQYFNEPSTRWGTIALMHSMVEVDKDKPKAEVFLVEMRSLSGFSGSPVIWRLPIDFEFYLTSQLRKKNEPNPIATRRVKDELSSNKLIGPWLIGIQCGSFPFYYPVVHEGTEKQIEDYVAKSHSGVAAVVPAWKLEELINSEDCIMARKKADDEISELKQQRTSKLDREAALPDKGDSFTRESFEDALKKASRKVPDEELKGE
jgi:hypothetical protein